LDESKNHDEQDYCEYTRPIVLNNLHHQSAFA